MRRAAESMDPRIGLLLTAGLTLFFVSFTAGQAWALRVPVLVSTVWLSFSAFFHPRFSIDSFPFSPIVIYKPLLVLAFGLNIAHMAHDPSHFGLSEAALVRAAWMLVGTVLLVDVLAFLVPTPPLPSASSWTRPRGSDVVFVLFVGLYVVGWGWRLYALSHGLLYGTLLATALEVTAYSNLLAWFGQISAAAYSGMLVFGRRLWPILVLLPLEIGWKWLGSSKAGPVYVIVPILVVLHAQGRLRVSGRAVGAVVAASVLFFISFVVIHEYRVESQRIILNEGYGAFSPLEAARNVTIDREAFEEASDALLERLAWGQGAATVLDAVESGKTTPRGGSTYLRSVSWIVPRALWPEKPDVSLGSWYAQEFLGWRFDSRSEAEITVWGEAALNFGAVGAILIPALWIVMLQAFVSACLRRGVWGTFLVATTYVAVMNALAVNVAVTVAAVGQAALVCLALAIGSGVLIVWTGSATKAASR